jgi:hypothetical protein
MARNRKRKTVRQPASEDRMKTAVIEVVEKGCPLQRAADIYNKCGKCKVLYGDKNDKKSDEEWLKCNGCARWFHDSCAQNFGILDDDDSFTCCDCV